MRKKKSEKANGNLSGTSTVWLFVHRNIRLNWNVEMLVFEERGKLEYPGQNLLSREEKRINNKLNPHIASSLRIDLEPHWWEASALTTAPSLLPIKA